jgi:hypothetical protein
VWLAQKDAKSYVQGMLDHFARTRLGAELGNILGPNDLPPAAAALFEAEYTIPGTLPGNWRSMKTWKELEKELAPRGSGPKAVTQFKTAKRKACDAAAAAALKRRGSSTGQQQPQPPRASSQQQQQQQQQRAGGEPPSGPRDSSASAGDADMAAWAPPQEADQQQQQQQQGAPGAAAERRTPESAMAAILEQKRRQNQQPPAALPSHPQQHQQAGGPPVHNSYSTPQFQLPPVPSQAAPVGVDPAVAAAEQRIMHEPLAPWMLWFVMGANRAVEEMIPPSPEKAMLLQVVSTAAAQDSKHMDLEELNTAMVTVLVRGKVHAPPDERHPWIALGQLIDAALQEGPSVPRRQHHQQQQHAPMAPAAAAAPGHMLPPHLRHMAGARAGLPPHLQQQAAQQQQQPPAAAAAGESSDDDDDTLLGMLGVDSTPAAAAAASAAADGSSSGVSGWAAVTGHTHEEEATGSLSSISFPPLGGSSAASGEDADYERALAASRAEQQQCANVPGVSVAGLANQTGEYNCFLNVVVQCLWNCKAFTQQVWVWDKCALSWGSCQRSSIGCTVLTD